MEVADVTLPGRSLTDVPPAVRRADVHARRAEANMVRNGALHTAVYSMGECTVFVSREPQARDGTYLWHLSISSVDRYPTWDEIKAARYRLLPQELCFCMFLPPPDLYADVSGMVGQTSMVFHVWEVDDPRKQWEQM